MLDANLTLDGIYIVFAAMAALIVAQFVHGGRNPLLEQAVLLDRFGPASAFKGTLMVDEERPGYLRLGSSSEEARRLRQWYRWIAGWGPQAKLDEVTSLLQRKTVQKGELSRKPSQSVHEN